MSENPHARAMWDSLEVAQKVVATYRNRYGQDPSDAELRVAATLFIEKQKSSRPRGGGFKKGGGGGGRSGGGASPPQQDRSIPILQRKPPRGKNKHLTWQQLVDQEPDYIEWALTTDWFTAAEAEMLQNAIQQGSANAGASFGSAPAHAGGGPDLSQPDDDLPF